MCEFSVFEGGPYPNATGNSNAHNMGVDRECRVWFFCILSLTIFCIIDTASMLIMVLAQAQASGNRELIDVYVRSTTRFPEIRSNIKLFFEKSNSTRY